MSRNDFSKTKRILLKKILGDIRLKYRTVWGKKFNFRYRSNYFTKRRISSKRKIESTEHHPPEKRSIPSSNDRKTQETQSLISEKDVLKSNFPSKMSRSKKKKEKKNSIFLIDRSDRYSKNLIGKRCFVKRDAVQREISFRGVPDFRAKCAFCGTKVFLEITVCRWKSSRGFGNTVTCWASR